MASFTSSDASAFFRILFLILAAMALGGAGFLLASGRLLDAGGLFVVFLALLAARAWAPVSLGLLNLAGVGALIATWLTLAGLYPAWEPLDDLVHFATLALIVPFSYVLSGRLGLLPSRDIHDLSAFQIIFLAALLGVSLGVVWEFAEWAVELSAPRLISLTHRDTMVDLVADLLGSLVAGAAIARFRLH